MSKVEEKLELLVEPNLPPLNEYASKIRTKLFLVSVIGFFLAFAGGIDSTSTLLGIRFKSLDPKLINYAFILAISYFLLHFSFSGYEHYHRAKIRLTALKKISVDEAGMSYDPLQFPSTPEDQSSIYSFFHARYLGNGAFDLKKHEYVSEEEVINAIEVELSYLKSGLNQFSKSFFRLQKVRAWEYLVFDIGMPWFLGILAIVSLYFSMTGTVIDEIKKCIF